MKMSPEGALTAYEADKDLFRKGAEDSTEENASKALANNVTTEDMDVSTKDNIRDKNNEEIKVGGSNPFMQNVVNEAIALARKRLNKPECLSGGKNNQAKGGTNGLNNSPETPEVKTAVLKTNVKQDMLDADSTAKALINAESEADTDKIKKDIQDKISAFDDAIDKKFRNEKIDELKALLETYLSALWKKNLFSLASKLVEVGGSGDLRRA